MAVGGVAREALTRTPAETAHWPNTLVYFAIAVVVLEIANLDCSRVYRGIDVIAVAA